MNGISIQELVSQTMEAMQTRGMSPQSVWSEYGHSFLPMIRFHEQRGKEVFDREVITEYVRTIETLYENGDISRLTYQNRKRAAGRLTEFHDTGRLEWSVPIKASRFVLNEYYEKILADLVPNEEIGSKAKRDLTWVGRKYFAWLMEEGHSDLSCVGADEVQGFMIYCSRHMASSGVHNIKLYMKKLYRYLSSHGYGNADYNGLLSFPVSRESKLYPAASHKEINQTLDMIDRRTPQGKGCRIYGRSKGYYVVFIGS